MTTTLPPESQPGQPPKKKSNATIVNMVLDSCTFVAFILAMQPHGTGIPIHEWGSVALSFAIILHLVLHWDWISGITRKLLSQLPTETRLGYLLNLIFYIDMTVIILSGLLISKSVLPALGLSVDEHAGPWRRLHGLSADAGIVILALHVAMHRKWIVNVFQRYVWGRLTGQAKAGR
ncbi:DUF4405 domain-containing protein [Deinococcus alpinitundrae]|uniref:DUF4405 domain-containing protein n=1 Tax=Deinococcus alpinitundrae TaxID=468913 RepID=UPI00137B3F8D|nr:DUF4405 domain-containing protein [Deinococcus alpinitundrae]